MGIKQLIWSLNEKKPLERAELINEQELQNLLIENIKIVNDGWMVISKEYETKAKKRVDILCMDYDGDIIVVETKKEQTPRDVTAQVLDYAASISGITPEDIAKAYLDFSGGKSLNEAYRERFGKELDESNMNLNVKMVIVAAKMDDGTERIIHFLREKYGVDINILFFDVYRLGDHRIISRAWLCEDMEESAPETKKEEQNWNEEYYASFGQGDRNWEDAQKYGFISAGGGLWYTTTLNMLNPGDRVWVKIPHVGFVGVGIVEEKAQRALETTFMVNGEQKLMRELPLQGNYFYAEDEPDKQEYVVKVHWDKTVSQKEAVSELGFFGNQNTVCRPTAQKWSFTIDRLKSLWGIE